MGTDLRFSGVIPANLLPFHDDLSMDLPNYRRHLEWLAGVEGVNAIVCNGHAAEISSLNRAERREALAFALEAVVDRVEMNTGIYTDNTLEGMEMAREAQAEGAAGMLVFPPTPFMWGAQLRPEIALDHFWRIADAVNCRSSSLNIPRQMASVTARKRWLG